jgi:hypothetical protein
MKKPALLVGERVGKFGSDCDGQPIPPRIRVVMVMNIMIAGRAPPAMPVAACMLVEKGASFGIESMAPSPLKRRGNFPFVNLVG